LLEGAGCGAKRSESRRFVADRRRGGAGPGWSGADLPGRPETGPGEINWSSRPTDFADAAFS